MQSRAIRNNHNLFIYPFKPVPQLVESIYIKFSKDCLCIAV